MSVAILSKLNPFHKFRFRSIKFEITVIYTLILAVILIIFSGMIYVILSRTLYAELDNEVTTKAEDIIDSIRSYLKTKGDDDGALLYAVEQTVTNEDKTLRRWWYTGFERGWFKRLDEQDLSQDYINFVSPEGQSLIHSPKMTDELVEKFRQLAHSMEETRPTFFYVEGEKGNIRVINYPFTDAQGKVFILQVGISPEPVIQLLYSWMNRVMLSIPILLLLTSFIGYVLASRILKPVQEITVIANNISYQDLNKRVEVTNFYTEMNSLIESFNDMISRLGKSFDHIEQFSAYMAHEIKTPLTIMKGEAELALLTKRTTREYQEALKVNLEEIDKVLKIVEDLLFLTNMDYQPGSFNMQRVEFMEYFHDVYEQAEFLARKKDIDLIYETGTLSGEMYIKADSLHLRRLFFNLIDNAIKFTPRKGKIKLALVKEKSALKASVSDTGEGIPPEKLPKIFDRFYRANDRVVGSGLGLSIAYSIAKLHNAKLDVQSELGQGTTFSVLIPIV